MTRNLSVFSNSARSLTVGYLAVFATIIVEWVFVAVVVF
jgi:hypothetical protein